MSSGAKNTNVKNITEITNTKSTTKAGSTSTADTGKKKLYKFLTYDEKLNYMIGIYYIIYLLLLYCITRPKSIYLCIYIYI